LACMLIRYWSVDELEQLVRIENNKRSSDSLESLPKVMSNVHDYFIYVASKVIAC
jgi:nucleoporin p58/p45